MHNNWVGRTYTVALLNNLGGHLDDGYVAFLYSGLKKVNPVKVSLPYFEIYIYYEVQFHMDQSQL